MSSLIVVLFIITALMGLVLIYYILRNKNTPKGLAIIHGIFAAIGIFLLLISFAIYSPKPYLSLIFFILAALGGMVMMYRDITGKSLPKWLALGHGAIAAIGFVLLLAFLYFTAHSGYTFK